MSKVLITGGAGFIGSHIADKLINLGHKPVILDNESTGIRTNVPQEAIYIAGDILNLDDLQLAFDIGIDAVFHIAGQASTVRSFDTPLDDMRTNLMGTINVVNKCLANEVPRLLHASSMTVYGHPERVPISESTACIPVSYYGISKYAAERFVHATSSRIDLPGLLKVTSFRMFNVYGERQRIDNPYQGVMGIFTGNVLRNEPIIIYGDGLQSRDFVYIDDVVDAWISAWQTPAAEQRVFNLGLGTQISINNLVDNILEGFGLTRDTYDIQYGPERPGDQRHMSADISSAQRILSWKPKVTLLEGIQRTIEWASTNA